MPQEPGDVGIKKNGMRWNQGERRGIITQMQLLSTRKRTVISPFQPQRDSRATRERYTKGNVFGTESRG